MAGFGKTKSNSRAKAHSQFLPSFLQMMISLEMKTGKITIGNYDRKIDEREQDFVVT